MLCSGADALENRSGKAGGGQEELGDYSRKDQPAAQWIDNGERLVVEGISEGGFDRASDTLIR